ncbi:hypothetical protein [Pedobacter nototheniae]|uniref:hypothetical protein n=1 Tax=Pedobacter nototheniae TaxID=2488994 RepID=UPI00292D6F4F|nr:hypothetical protein [Pedobacter nototheniae]
MKKIFLIAAIMMVSLFSINGAKAQVSLSINIGSQPLWGPTGYNHVDYYYLPDINAYYYVPSGQYIYLNNGRWVWVNSLPPMYSNFNLYNAYKVVINKPKPYLQNNIYVSQYGKYKNYGGKQTVIRDSRDSKYYVVKGHPNYNGNNRPNNVQVNRPTNNNRPSRNNQVAKPTNNNQRPGREANNNGRGERGGEQRKGNERH